MHVSLVMTIIGQDRPGLVESVASLIADHGGNWLESRMSHLGGQFAGILRVQLPGEQEEALVRALKSLETKGLSIVVIAEQPKPAAGAEPLTLLEIVGQDRPGIVRQISLALASHGVNVEELDTECHSAPMSGETLFQAQAKLRIPASCNTAELRLDLEKIAADLIVDISIAPLPPIRPAHPT
ncbi:MAG: ACT domain-containing protein [Verrucomicrobiota bacterium]